MEEDPEVDDPYGERVLHWMTCEWRKDNFEYFQRLVPNHVFPAKDQADVTEGFVRVKVFEWVNLSSFFALTIISPSR